jgi:hypothetical protein
MPKKGFYGFKVNKFYKGVDSAERSASLLNYSFILVLVAMKNGCVRERGHRYSKQNQQRGVCIYCGERR